MRLWEVTRSVSRPAGTVIVIVEIVVTGLTKTEMVDLRCRDVSFMVVGSSFSKASRQKSFSEQAVCMSISTVNGEAAL